MTTRSTIGKRMLCFLLATLMIFSQLPVSALAEEIVTTPAVSLEVGAETLTLGGETISVTAALVDAAFTQKGDADVQITVEGDAAELTDGVLTPLKAGEVIITASLTGTAYSEENTGGYQLAEGYNSDSVSLTVTVEEPRLEKATNSSDHGNNSLQNASLPDAVTNDVNSINVCEIVGGSQYATVQAAVNAATSGQTVHMIADSQENIVVGNGKNIILDLNGYVLSSLSGSVIKNGGTLEIKDSNSGSQTHNFKVGEDNLWTLTSETEGAVAYENLTDRPAAGTIVTVTGGCITGAAFCAIGDSNGGGIDNGAFLQSDDSVLTLSGGNIVGNKVTSTVEYGSSAKGGGVLNSGTFTMNGGMIAGNLVCGSTGEDSDNSGGDVYNSGDFTMNDGAISFNTAVGDGGETDGFGGGVINKYGTFTMEGGLIGYNNAEYAGGIISSTDSELTIRGGTISDNRADIGGGGIYSEDSATVIIQGGNFTNNTAYHGGAVCIYGPATITGGTYAGNTAKMGCGIFAAHDFTLGGSVTITGHTRTTGEKDNLYLAKGALITLDNYTGTCGVRKDGSRGVISTETDKKYVSNFISDNELFGIHFNADNRLEISPFTVTVNSSQGGSAAANPSSSTPNYMISISATPDEGYECAAITVVRNDTGEAVPTYNDNFFFMPASDVTVTVTFAESRTITNKKPENGSVMINGSDAATVKAKVGSEVTLEATADAGYALKAYHVYKTGDESTTVKVTDGSFTMPDYDVTVTAEFEKAYAVTIGKMTGCGSVTTDKTSAKQGEMVTLTVTPVTNYAVSWVKVTGADSAEIQVSAIVEGTCTFTMPGQDVTVTAAFEGWGDLTIGASVTGATTKAAAAEFTYTLTLTEGSPAKTVAGEYNYTTSEGRTGKIKSGGTITLKDGQTATVKDLPADISYEVTESVLSGFSVTAITGGSGVINAGQTAQASFTNTYKTAGSVQLKADKTLSGRTLQKGQFSFQLLDSEGSEVLRTAACEATGTVTFGTITYDNADDGKTCTYYIRELVPDDAKNAGGVTWKDATDEQKDAGGFSLKGYTYDSTKRRVEVAVADNGNGTMTATPTYYNAAGTKTAGITIANEYHATGTATLSLWTTLKGRDLMADEFTFGLYKENGTTPVTDAKGNAITVKNTAEGTVEFPALSYAETDIGKTYTYVVKEIVPEETDPEYDKTVIYDTTPWTFEVAVSDNGNGTLSLAQTVKDKDGKEGVVPVVQNTLKDGLLSITNILQSGDASQEFKYIVKFTSPTGDDLDGNYTFSRKEIVSNEIIPTAAISTASTFGDRSEAAFSVVALSEEQSENTASEEAEALFTPMGNIGSGTCGTCSWVIDANGCLTIKPTNGTSGTLDSCTSGYPEWGWYDFDYRTSIKSVKFEPGVKAGEGLYKLFGECSSLTSVDLTNLDTSDTTIMSSMFVSCSKLTDVSGLSTLDTSKVENVASMFATCSSLKTLDLSGFDTSSVTTMMQMFNRCSSLETLTFKTKTSSKFVTSNVTDMRRMFNGCTSLQTLDLSNFNTSKITNKSNMLDMFGADSTPSTSVIPCTALRTVTLGANFSFMAGGTVATKLPTPTAEGYSGKWKWNGTGKTVASLTAAELAAAYPNDTTAPAGTWVWEESTSYTVTFNANGGKGTMADMTCEPGTEYTLTANTFYRLGYTFTGWNTKADGSGTAYADGAAIKDLGSSTLYAQWQAEGPGKMTDGQMEVTLHGNECLTIEGVPAGTQYQVYEETPAGWVLVSQSGTSGVVETLTTAASSFTNKYDPNTAQAAILGYVTVDGSAGKVDSGSYSFQLKNSDSTVIETVTCGAGGSIAFSPLTYTAAGTYTYTVSQVIPGETGYIEYDNHTETVTVTVTDDGTGNLSAAVTYDESGVVFDNKDNTPAPQGTLQITNTVMGTTAADKDFTFTVVAVSGGAATTQTKTAKAGETVEVGTFDAGTTYTITETGIPAGYTMTSQTGAKGTITADTTSTAAFANTYAATGSATLQASKTLTDGMLAEGQFSFVLKEGDTTLQTVACVANGSVTFQPIIYTVAGEHTYTISEAVPEDAVNAEGVKWSEATAEQKAAGGFYKDNVRYDSHTENVTVEASDNGEGVITTNITYDTDGAIFTNTVLYSVTAATCSNGTVAADKARATAGDTITVTATAANGFKIDKVYYNDGTLHEISAASGVYSFTMPAKAVTVSATFVHTHNWTYSLSKDKTTISATCTAGCDYTGIDKSLTIQSPDSLTYDGNSHNATFGEATSFLGDNKLPEITYAYKTSEDGTYAPVSDIKAAGYYKASFTVGSGTDARTAYVEYVVAQKQLTMTGTTANGKNYDGTTTAAANRGEVTGIVEGDNVDVEIKSANFLDKNAGNGKGVVVSYKLTGDDAGNYTAPADDMTTADISPKQLSVSTEAGKITTAKEKEYDGTTDAEATIGTVEGIETEDDVTVAVKSATFEDKDVGNSKKVTVVYEITGDDAGNYTKPIDDSVSANITKRSVTLTSESATKIYDGTALTNDTVTQSNFVDGESAKCTMTGTQTDAGESDNSFTYEAGQNTDLNNYDIQTSFGKLLVTQRPVTLTSATDSKVYDGKALTNSNVAVSGDGFADGEGATYNVTGSQTDAGISKNTFTYTLNESTKAANYSITQVEGDLTVTKADARILNVPTDAKVIYTGEPQALVKAGTCSGGTMQYVLGTKDQAGTDWSTVIPQATEAGTYYVWYKVAGDKNHNDVAGEKPVTVTMAEKYLVVFNSKGGSIVSSVYVVSGDKVNKPEDPERDGYTFTNWYTDEDCTIVYNFDTAVIEKTVLYAGWQEIPATKYNVTFDCQGGSVVESQSVVEGKTAVQPDTPSRDGHTFGGWYTTAACSQLYDFDTEVTGDITLYAKWTQTDVNLNVDKAVKVDESIDEDLQEVVEAELKDNSKTLVTDLEKSIDEKGENAIIDKAGVEKTDDTTIDIDITVNITAKAADTTEKMEVVYEVKPQAVVKTIENGEVTSVSDPVDVSNDELNGEVFSVKTPTLGMTPVEVLHTDANGTVKDVFHNEEIQYDEEAKTVTVEISSFSTITISGEKTYATVSFDANGHGTAPASQCVRINHTAEKPENPEAAGCTFNDWYTTTAGTKAYDFSTAVTDDITLYAGWTVNPTTYIIQFDANGGKGQMAEMAAEEGQQVTLTANAFTIEKGQHFAGWSESEEGSVVYGDEFQVTDLAEPGKTVVLYAQWEADTYQVIFNSNGGTEIKVPAQSLYCGAPVDKPDDDPQRDGYVFCDWYLDAAGTKAWNFEEDTLTADMVQEIGEQQVVYLYAKWLKDIQVWTDSAEKVYDGIALRAKYHSEGLLKGDALVMEMPSLTNAGSISNMPESITIMRGEADVTAEYAEISVASGRLTTGTLTVRKRPISLISPNAWKIYDGKALTAPEVYGGWFGMPVDAVFASEVEYLKATGSITDVSDSPVTNSIIWSFKEDYSEDNYVIRKFEGQLWVTASDKLVIMAQSYSGKYDGEAVSGKAEVNVETGTKVTYSIDGGKTWTEEAPILTNAGKLEVIAKAENSNYETAVCDYVIEVLPREVTLTSASAEKVYDGTPLTNSNVAVSGDGFADGEGATYNVTGSQTEVGSSANTFTYTLNNNTKADNYKITCVEGTLTVTAAAGGNNGSPGTGTDVNSMIPAVLALIACAGALVVVMKKRNNA